MFKKIFFAILYLCLASNGHAQQKRFAFTQQKMGSPFTIILYSNDSIQAINLAKQCFTLVDSFNLIFSDYTDSSEVGKLNATAANDSAFSVSVSPALLAVLIASKNAFDKSSGAFDITIGALVKVWRKARKAKTFPTNEMVRLARSVTGFNKLIIDSANKKLTRPKPGLLLDFGGIAKGWIAQKIINFLLAQQINAALVNAGGDIAMSGAPPGTTGWVIGVNVPETMDELLSKKLILHHLSVATSGDAYQFIENKGIKYSHIIDPKTGYGVTFQRNVTVIARDGATADWLATACSILPEKKAKRLATQMHAQLLMGKIKKGKFVFNATKGFAVYWKQPVE